MMKLKSGMDRLTYSCTFRPRGVGAAGRRKVRTERHQGHRGDGAVPGTGGHRHSLPDRGVQGGLSVQGVQGESPLSM